MEKNKNKIHSSCDIKALKISIANPEDISRWSCGEITNAETLNYKTLKPEAHGLFDEVIFGPVRDYTCSCGKYHSIKYHGRVCDKCGVAVIKSVVRRERMGHIELATPISHIWYVRDNPSKIALALDIRSGLEEVVYFIHYIVLEVPKSMQQYFSFKQIINISNDKKERQTRLNFRKVITNVILPKLSKSSFEYKILHDHLNNLKDRFRPFAIYELLDLVTQYTGVKFGTGSQAIKTLLDQVNINEEISSLTKKCKINTPDLQYNKTRLKFFKEFKNSNNKLSSMILKILPVIPPETRPLIQLETGNFTTRDVNELYRRIIIRNNRLKEFININAPTNIINNETRLLQNAVDALLDNEATTKVTRSNRSQQELKSITDRLKGKTGLFRQNLLGKRVDFSGRSVIVGNPKLKLYEAGIPTSMALRIFRPFIIAELIRKNDEQGNEIAPIASNVHHAEKIFSSQSPVVWEILNNVVLSRPIILNRAPSLHRLSFQAFEIKLVTGNAICLHPLVCSGFNADFDGDTMAIHLPITPAAISEARSVMLSALNVVSPKDGKPIVSPTIDIVTGIYWLTIEKKDCKGQGNIFANVNDLINAYSNNEVDLHAIIGIDSNIYKNKGVSPDRIIITSVGKVIFNNIFPNDFEFINNIANENRYLPLETSFDDFINDKKFTLAPAFDKSRISSTLNKLFEKYGAFTVAKVADSIKDLGFQYASKAGITFSFFDLPEYSKKEEYFVEAYKNVNEIANSYKDGLITDDGRYLRTIEEWQDVNKKVLVDIKNLFNNPEYLYNPIIIMANSGARGNVSQLSQLLGMRGLMSRSFNYSKNTTSNIIRDTIEVPITHSFREGVDISEFFNASFGARKAISDVQMKTSKSGYMTRKLVDASQEVIITENDCGSHCGVVVSNIYDNNGNVVEKLEDRIVSRYTVGDVCDSKGTVVVPADTYITSELAKKIVASGITEVEVRSVIHCNCANGVCQKCYGGDISTNKLVEVGTAVGVIAAQSIGEPITQINLRSFHTGGVAGGPQIAQGYERMVQLIECIEPKEHEVSEMSPCSGKVQSIKLVASEDKVLANDYHLITIVDDNNQEYNIRLFRNAFITVNVGDRVSVGQKLNVGSLRFKDIVSILGIDALRSYIISEVQKMYRSQGIDINDKYIEIIVLQMTRKMIVIDSGDSDLNIGDVLSNTQVAEVNTKLFKANKKIAITKPIILGLPNIPTYSSSFLAAASFQYTKRALINAAIKNQIDYLSTIKENVMLGRLIPVGTGLKKEEDVIKSQNSIIDSEY